MKPILSASKLQRLQHLAASFEKTRPRKNLDTLDVGRPKQEDDTLGNGCVDGTSINSPASTSSTSTSDEDRERVLLQIAVDLKSTLVAQNVPGDGNCLYHSVAMQTMGAESHMAVKRDVLEEVEKNQLHYNGFTDNVIEWVEKQRAGAWGDGLALKACSHVYHSPIFVWRKRLPSQRPTIFLPPTLEGDSSPPICLELDEPTGSEHYSPLMPCNESPSTLPWQGENKEETAASDTQDDGKGSDAQIDASCSDPNAVNEKQRFGSSS